jgi:hypothetical protein
LEGGKAGRAAVGVGVVEPDANFFLPRAEGGLEGDRPLLRLPLLVSAIRPRISTKRKAKCVDPLFSFLPELLSLSESPFSLATYGLGLDRSFPDILTLAAAFLAAPRRVEPLNPRQDERWGAYRVETICCQLGSIEQGESYPSAAD